MKQRLCDTHTQNNGSTSASHECGSASADVSHAQSKTPTASIGLSGAQKDIATTLDRPLFVEAGAGSGKTFTLTQRVLWALSPESGRAGKPYIEDLSQVLIITFTHAAAREIKERLRKSLREAHMPDAAAQVDSAWISTIHGMCKRILMACALELGIDPRVQVANENERLRLRLQAERDVIMAKYHEQEKDPLFSFLQEYYGLADATPGNSSTYTKGLFTLVRALSSRAHLHESGFSALKTIDPSTFMQSMSALYRHLVVFRDEASLSATEEAAISRTLTRFEELRPRVQEFVASFGACALALRVKEMKALEHELVELYKALPAARSKNNKETIFALKCEAYALVKSFPLAIVAHCFDLCKELAAAIDARYQELKRASAVVDQDDLISLALSAVEKAPQVLTELRAQFKLVMVDEFQDTDNKQLKLISFLAGEHQKHLATVGDAQQSIYKFRGADVSVFYARKHACDTVFRLDTNYRSHADILSFVAKICDGRNKNDACPGLFPEFMDLKPNESRKSTYHATPLPRIDVEMVKAPSSMSFPMHKVEAYMCARRMKAYISAGQEPGDMALLLGKTTHCDCYLDAMRRSGISCVVSGGSSFSFAPEVRVVADLLRVLANPADTKHGLFPLLTSPLFGLDDQDLLDFGSKSELNSSLPIKRPLHRGLEQMTFYHDHVPSLRAERAHKVLMQARQMLPTMPVSAVCLEVIKRSGWLERLSAEGASTLPVQANILAAIHYIHDLCEELGLGPARAAKEFGLWLDQQKIPPASLAGGARTSVQVMTVHASKGLEFPMVFLAEWSAPKPRATQALVYAPDPHDQTGDTELCLLTASSAETISTPKGFAEFYASKEPESPQEWLMYTARVCAQKDEEESYRVLYVALTRAREALCVVLPLTLSADGLQPDLAARVAMRLGIENKDVGIGEFDYQGTQAAMLHVCELSYNKKDGGTYVSASDAFPELNRLSYPASPKEWEQFDLCASAVTEAAAPASEAAPTTAAPTAESVSAPTAPAAPAPAVFSLYTQDACFDDFSVSLVRNTNGLYSYSFVQAQQELIEPAAIDSSKKHSLHEPNSSEAATTLGSCFHALAQLIIEQKGAYPSEEQLTTLMTLRSLPVRVQKRVRSALERWYHSKLFASALTYPSVRAEVPFYVPRASAYGSVLEGAFDLLCSDDAQHKALVIDYKTGDRSLTPQAIEERHRLQAKLYCEALATLGYTDIRCAFVCVELAGEGDEPFVVYYDANELLSQMPEAAQSLS